MMTRCSFPSAKFGTLAVDARRDPAAAELGSDPIVWTARWFSCRGGGGVTVGKWVGRT
jgi:hypothetical protein